MKPEDDEPSPTDEELREAAALADALENDARPDAAPPIDALETASLLRHARAALTVPPEAAAAAPPQPFALSLPSGERGPRHRSRRLWIAASFAVTAAAAAWLLFATTLERSAGPPVAIRPPTPTAGLLAAQAEATRGGRAALARLDEEMRAYRRQYLGRGEP